MYVFIVHWLYFHFMCPIDKMPIRFKFLPRSDIRRESLCMRGYVLSICCHCRFPTDFNKKGISFCFHECTLFLCTWLVCFFLLGALCHGVSNIRWDGFLWITCNFLWFYGNFWGTALKSYSPFFYGLNICI